MNDLISRAEALKCIPSEEPISRMVIAQLPSVKMPRWIPVKTRPMATEERQYYEETCGWSLSDEEAIMFESLMPGDGQEVWVCNKYGNVFIDICTINEGFGLESNGDWADVVAWMPHDHPEPYREVEE